MNDCLTKTCHKHGDLPPNLIRARPSGRTECRLCIRERVAAWVAANPKRAAAAKHARYVRNKAQYSAKHKAYVERNKDVCAANKRRWTKDNKERVDESKKKYLEKNPDKVRDSKERWWAANSVTAKKARKKRYASGGKQRERQMNLAYVATHQEELKAASKQYRKTNAASIARKKKTRMDRMRLAAISHYSEDRNACKLCGMSDISKLCLDHIDESGARHRKDPKVRTTHSLLEWFNKHGYSDGFQVLCWNCNWLKHLKPCNSVQARCNRKLKQMVLDHYCGEPARCVLCGIDDLRILTIDHVDGGGKKHRSSHKLHGGPDFYRWLRDQEFPPGYRVLCFNCNCGPA